MAYTITLTAQITDGDTGEQFMAEVTETHDEVSRWQASTFIFDMADDLEDILHGQMTKEGLA